MMADRKVEDRSRMARAQWGSGNWGPELSLHEGLEGTEAEERTAEAAAVIVLAPKLPPKNRKQ